jgi:hypothetical protein
MNSLRADLPAWGLALVGLVGMIVLAALNHAIPQTLTDVTVIAAGAGAGIAMPSRPYVSAGTVEVPTKVV